MLLPDLFSSLQPFVPITLLPGLLWQMNISNFIIVLWLLQCVTIWNFVVAVCEEAHKVHKVPSNNYCPTNPRASEWEAGKVPLQSLLSKQTLLCNYGTIQTVSVQGSPRVLTRMSSLFRIPKKANSVFAYLTFRLIMGKGRHEMGVDVYSLYP